MDFVRVHYAQNKVILIACGAGISRSATFAIAALRQMENLPLLEAWRIVKTAHPEAMPHPALWESLCNYYGEDIPVTAFLAALHMGD
jgi:protein-tyrosine phosphatase